MDGKVIRLVNILQDRFVIPDKTNGENILMTFSDIAIAVNSFWKMSDGDWTEDNLLDALEAVGVPWIVNMSNVRIYLLIVS